MSQSFSEQEVAAVYRAISSRRDVRSGFLSKKIAADKLTRVLQAAHEAPSVGFLQPWNFVVIDSLEVKSAVKEAFIEASQTEAELFEGEQKSKYEALKLEGIMEAPLNICITCDRERNPQNLLGRSVQPDMDLYSTVCAVQNLWLAARVEGLGMGWVSILKKERIRDILNLPETIEPVAYLCLGYVDEFYEKPELEIKDWQERLDLDDLIKYNQW
jgi:5,6-dimethylbenzimidazole synthase